MKETKITFYGHALFVIESSEGTKIGIDPYDQQIKTSLPDVRADIVISSHDHFDHNNISLFRGKPRLVDAPISINMDDIEFEGISSYHDEKNGALRGNNIIFKFEVDGLKFAHLGDLGHMLDKDRAGLLKDLDIMMVPVGGTYTIDSGTALDIIKKVKPKVVIPMHYKEEDTKLDVAPLESFTSKVKDHKELGHSIKVSRETLPQKTEIWVLSSS